MPDALLDIIGVVPVQLVFAYALTKMLNIRRLSCSGCWNWFSCCLSPRFVQA